MTSSLDEDTRFDTDGATYEIDPGVESVWRAHGKNSDVDTVRLRGYRDRYGLRRLSNDTEETQ